MLVAYRWGHGASHRPTCSMVWRCLSLLLGQGRRQVTKRHSLQCSEWLELCLAVGGASFLGVMVAGEVVAGSGLCPLYAGAARAASVRGSFGRDMTSNSVVASLPVPSILQRQSPSHLLDNHDSLQAHGPSFVTRFLRLPPPFDLFPPVSPSKYPQHVTRRIVRPAGTLITTELLAAFKRMSRCHASIHVTN